MVLGGGPYRIGQGIEFDYCCVHAAFTLREAGYETIMVNCNPETVSTDYDTSDKLYFEPLTVEDVLSIYEKERPEGVLIQFGGQTPLNIARELQEAGVTVLGTTPETIDLAEDRERFREMMAELAIPMPASGIARSSQDALAIAEEIGYPVIVRPSYVLGGRGMEIVFDEESLHHYVDQATEISPQMPILVDRFLENAIEAEADALSDGTTAFVPSVMQHIEFAGIHSGDSACVIPPVIIEPQHMNTINEYTRRIAVKFRVVGLLNIQYAIALDGRVYVLEANPRASRTVPLVSKVCGFSMARAATKLALGAKLSDLDLQSREVPYFGVKEAVFPFNMFPEVDPLLGPEMRSTGEVLAMADSFGLAFFKAQEAAQQPLPTRGNVLITVADRDKERVLPAAREFSGIGFTLRATRRNGGVPARQGHRLRGGHEGPRGPAPHRRRDHERVDRSPRQHASRLEERARRLDPSQGGDSPRRSLHHDHDGSPGRRPGHPDVPGEGRGGDGPSGAPPGLALRGCRRPSVQARAHGRRRRSRCSAR